MVSKLVVNFVLVVLKDGTTTNMGNVFALNSETGIFGPVCDDNWSIEDVRSNNISCGNFEGERSLVAIVFC